MPLILPSNSISAVGYEVDNSLRFNSGSSDSLSKAFSSNGTRTKWTWSIWFKRSKLSGSNVLGACYFNDSNEDRLEIDSNGQMIWYSYQSNSYVGRLKTNRKFRDISAWYHLVLRWDTGDSTADNRMKIWINGVEETSFAIRNNPSSDAESLFNYGNGSQQWVIGHTANVNHWGGYMAEIVFCDNQKLDPTSFGEFDEDTGIWKPIDVSGLTFGTNGFYLDFENSGSLGADVSGNGNNFTVNNLTSIDQTTDTCTNNFATWNPLHSGTTLFTNVAFKDGNTTFDNNESGTGVYPVGFSSIGVSQGKWYCEIKFIADVGTALTLGIEEGLSDTTYGGIKSTGIAYKCGDGQIRKNNSDSSYGNTYTVGDIIGIALDLDNNYIYFSKNGTWQNSGDPTSGATGTGGVSVVAVSSTTTGVYHFSISDNSSSGTFEISANFGNPPYTISSGNSDGNGYGNFEYAVPSGYYALNTKNLAEYG